MDKDKSGKSAPRVDVNLPKQSLFQDMGDWLAEKLADGDGYGRKHPDRVFMSRVLGDLTKMDLDSDSEKKGTSSKNKAPHGQANAHATTNVAMHSKKDSVSQHRLYHPSSSMGTPNGDKKVPMSPEERAPSRVTICEPPNPKNSSRGSF